MSNDIQNLKTVHHAVARYMAFGHLLPDICQMLGLNLTRWKEIVRSPLFQDRVSTLRAELDAAIMDDYVKDPVLAHLNTLKVKAVERLAIELDEVDSEDSSATSNTRLKAAFGILDRTGYRDKADTDSRDIIFISLSEDKLNAVQAAKGKEIPPQGEKVGLKDSVETKGTTHA
ncbi:MAG: hypothetical protein GY861_25210 [bacterium]|nr:hypothetical protein [bacterium]